MALDLRLQQKMTQQLVMTPQLQQAIKLLQLSHMELAEAIHEEMEQNPVLEERSDGDGGDGEVDDSRGELSSAEASVSGEDVETYGDINSAAQDAPNDATPEPSSREVDREIDWEAYLESQSYSLPASAAGTNTDELPSYEATLSQPTSLLEHLRWQLQMAAMTEEQMAIGMLLAEEINEDGYLSGDGIETVAAQMEVSAGAVEDVLREMQQFDPVGVGARSLRECLLIQLSHMGHEDPLVFEIVDKHLQDVERRNLQSIARSLNVASEQVARAVRFISQLEPRPGRLYSDREPQYITPDIYVHKVGDDYVIVLNEDGLPKLRISGYYRQAMQNAESNAKSYIQEKLRSAAWLIRSIHMRQRTIYRVMESILKFQRDFFDKGTQHLKPLILKDVAEDVGMHESTISRVTTNKYVHTPQGIFELKYFFNSSINGVGGENIASESVRDHIKSLISSENPKAPLSDQAIVKALGERGINIARRTVAKYREMLKIPSSSKRKQLY